MIVENELKKLIHKLVHEEVAQIQLGDSKVNMHLFEQSTKISLSSTVYIGDNFVPMSVRKCLSSQTKLKMSTLNTHLSLDEETYQISLHHIGSLDYLNTRTFVDLLEEFSWLADQWRSLFDEHDKQDLVPVLVPKRP